MTILFCILDFPITWNITKNSCLYDIHILLLFIKTVYSSSLGCPKPNVMKLFTAAIYDCS
jgi:hypothetical protein